ncbi:MAG TPA: hypothetical protein VFN21_01640, partial [Acidimicrobiales bacterium]|nr:hypothetical protein [Acidimicrobiales bacterium]
ESLDPIRGGLACTTVPADDQGDGVATYRLPAATGDGFTMLGSPTVNAEVSVQGEYSYLAARLFDVDPTTNTEVLIARSVYRIDPDDPDGPVEFQLEPNGWHFAAGHIPKLELLGQDEPFLAPSTGTSTVTVSNLELRLPVRAVDDSPDDPDPTVTTSPDVTTTTTSPEVTSTVPEVTTSVPEPITTPPGSTTTQPDTTPSTTIGSAGSTHVPPRASQPAPAARPVPARPDYTG